MRVVVPVAVVGFDQVAGLVFVEEESGVVDLVFGLRDEFGHEPDLALACGSLLRRNANSER